MKYTSKNTIEIFLLSSLLLISTVASCETYLIDFSQFETPGGNWNSLLSNQTTNVALIDDETGVNGAATLSHTLGGVDSNISGGWTAGNVGWIDTAAVSDGIYSFPNASVTISGLSNGSTYAIDLVAVETEFPSVADFQVHGQFADSNRLGTTALGDDWNTAVDGLNNWLTWDAVMPNSGSITLSVYAPGGYTTLNAIRIRSVGTPNTPPTATNFTAQVTENQTHTFLTSDFSYSDADADPLDHLVIEQIPAHGVLYLDGNNNDSFDNGEGVNTGESVIKSELDNGNLQYIQNGANNTSFQFEVNDGIESSDQNYVATLNLTPVPAVVNSVSVPNAMTYNANSSLNFSVVFSKIVDVNQNNGSPGLELTIGSSVVMADYQGGSGSNTLNFTYSIQAGDFDNDGIGVNALLLNNGSIQSNGTVDANLTLNAVGDTSLVLVDAVAPQVQSVTRLNPATSPTSADQVTLRYTFTEAVNNVQDGNFFSNNPSVITSINATSFAADVYDVEFSGSALAEFNGSIVFGLIPSGISDSANNPMISSAVIGTNNNSYEFINLYFIGGTVNGLLEGNYMVLTNNDGDDEIITTNGPYVFDTPLTHQESFQVDIDLTPIDPIQPCQIFNASAAINGDDVTNIDVTCEVGNDLINRNGFEQIDVN